MLGEANVFSTLDLRSGYWQTKLSEKSKELTAFTAGPIGFYEWNRLPFGLCNSGATFQRMIKKALEELICWEKGLRPLFIKIELAIDNSTLML